MQLQIQIIDSPLAKCAVSSPNSAAAALTSAMAASNSGVIVNAIGKGPNRVDDRAAGANATADEIEREATANEMIDFIFKLDWDSNAY